MIFLSTISVLFLLFAPVLIPLFSQDPDVIQQGVLCLRIICLGYIFYAYGMVIGQAFNGAGDTITPSWINFIAFWTLQIPLSYTFAKLFHWGPVGVYWAIAISESFLAVLAVYIFRKGKWKNVKI